MSSFDLRALLAALYAGGVQHVVIGGVAVGAHGFIRATQDVDLVPDPGAENLLRLSNALVALGAVLPLAGDRPFDHADLGPGGNLTLETVHGGLDVIQRASGVPVYAELEAAAVPSELLGVPVRICSLAHLRAMKRAAGRPIDLADLDGLPEV